MKELTLNKITKFPFLFSQKNNKKIPKIKLKKINIYMVSIYNSNNQNNLNGSYNDIEVTPNIDTLSFINYNSNNTKFSNSTLE